MSHSEEMSSDCHMLFNKKKFLLEIIVCKNGPLIRTFCLGPTITWQTDIKCIVYIFKAVFGTMVLIICRLVFLCIDLLDSSIQT